MLKNKWRFKKSFLDPVSGMIYLYYIGPDGKVRTLISHKSLKEHIWTNLPEDFPSEEAQNHAKLMSI